MRHNLGAREHNKVGAYLDAQPVDPTKHTARELAAFVHQFLTTSYRPRELGVGEVGYHVAGFGSDQTPIIHHVFWGFDRPRRADQRLPEYKIIDHSPSPGTTCYLYNGRNELAEPAVRALLAQMLRKRDVRYDVTTVVGMACFVDFVIRFASELAPEVGPPIITRLIATNNHSVVLRNDQFAPLPADRIAHALAEMDHQPSRTPAPFPPSRHGA